MLFNFFRPIRTPEELVQRKPTLQGLCSWIEFNIWYEPGVKFFPSSEQVLKIREANCKGFAVLTYDCLKLMGYDPHIITITADERGDTFDGKYHHVVVFVEIGRTWHCVSCGVLSRHDEQATLLGAVKDFKPNATHIAEVDMKGSHIMTLLSKI